MATLPGVQTAVVLNTETAITDFISIKLLLKDSAIYWFETEG